MLRFPHIRAPELRIFTTLPASAGLAMYRWPLPGHPRGPEVAEVVIGGSGFAWHRNAISGGFSIPLLSEGDTSSFYPDFIIWKKGLVYCLDTKGGHLFGDAVARKLFDIQDDGSTKVRVRFITEGSELRGKVSKDGYTVWKTQAGSPAAIPVDDLNDALTECQK